MVENIGDSSMQIKIYSLYEFSSYLTQNPAKKH